MSIVKTTRFGEVEYNDDEVVYFQKGILGFERDIKFLLIKLDLESPFAFLQSLETPELTFVVAEPFSFFQEYEFDLADSVKEELAIEKFEDIAIWSILTIPENFQKTTINLLAPIIINVEKRIAKQIVLNDPKYSIKSPLYPHIVAKGGE